MSLVFLSTALPGVPVWQTPPEVLQEVLLSSINFFYINTGLHALGLSVIPDVPVSVFACRVSPKDLLKMSK
jgi:hypothetical protein